MSIKVEDQVFAGKTAQEWREMSYSRYKRADESFERCDTDGFLSQYASEVMASHYHYCAEVAEMGGTITTAVLFKDGGVVEGARNVSTRYGMSWVQDTENGPIWFSESQAQTADKRRAYFMKKHEGYTLGFVRVKAGLNSRTGEAFPIRDEIVEIISTDDVEAY